MIKQEKITTCILLALPIAIISIIVAGIGIINPAIYRYTAAEKSVAGTMAQDIISFLIASALLIISLHLRKQNSSVVFIWFGLIGYLFYAFWYLRNGGII